MDDSDEDRKVKDNVHRSRGHGGQMGSTGVAILFLTSVLDRGRLSTSRPITLPPGKTRYML